MGIYLVLGPLTVALWWGDRKRGKKGKRRSPWMLVVAVMLMVGVGGVVVGCGPEDEPIEWEDIVCTDPVYEPPASPHLKRRSQEVEIIHVSGPNATLQGGYDWRVRFQLVDPQGAKADGWIIQEVAAYYHWSESNGLDWEQSTEIDPNLPLDVFYEAWEVKKGEREPTSEYTVGFGADRYNDHYLHSDRYEDVVSGEYWIEGIVKFYSGTAPGFTHSEVWWAGNVPKSSASKPRYWDNTGTWHNFGYMFYRNKHGSGYMHKGNQMARFSIGGPYPGPTPPLPPGWRW